MMVRWTLANRCGRSPWLLLLVVLLSGCASPSPRCAGLPGEPMLTADLYFGRTRDDEAAWRDFLAAVVAPRFSSGFTVLDGTGQWRQRATGRVVSERSTMLEIVAEQNAATLAALETIRTAYRERFSQESVGLVLTESCASF